MLIVIAFLCSRLQTQIQTRWVFNYFSYTMNERTNDLRPTSLDRAFVTLPHNVAIRSAHVQRILVNLGLVFSKFLVEMVGGST